MELEIDVRGISDAVDVVGFCDISDMVDDDSGAVDDEVDDGVGDGIDVDVEVEVEDVDVDVDVDNVVNDAPSSPRSPKTILHRTKL